MKNKINKKKHNNLAHMKLCKIISNKTITTEIENVCEFI